MSRILKTGKPAQDRRSKELSLAATAKPRKSIISMDDLRTNLVCTPSGQRTTLLAMSDDEFRGWFDAFAESIVPFAKPGDGAMLLIGAAKDGVYVIPLDEETRMYFVNEVYQTAAYRRSGIEIFASDKEATA